MVGDLQRIKEYPEKGFQIEQELRRSGSGLLDIDHGHEGLDLGDLLTGHLAFDDLIVVLTNRGSRNDRCNLGATLCNELRKVQDPLLTSSVT